MDSLPLDAGKCRLDKHLSGMPQGPPEVPGLLYEYDLNVMGEQDNVETKSMEDLHWGLRTDLLVLGCVSGQQRLLLFQTQTEESQTLTHTFGNRLGTG